MLIRLFEFLFISIFNRLRRGWGRRTHLQPAAAPAVPPDHVVIGRAIPAEAMPGSDAVARRLLDSGIVALSPEARQRHLYILGATGTGKTNLLLQLIQSDIQNRRAFCVIDLRGDLVDRILLRLAQTAPADEWRRRLLLVDLRQEEQVVGFNPLLGEGDAYNRALHVLSVLKQQSESWGVQLEETLRNSLVALAHAGWSLLEIEPLLTNSAFRGEVLRHVSDSHVRNFFARYEQMTGANQLAAASAVLNKVTPLIALPQLRLMFGQTSTFSFGDLLDREPGMIILISLAVDRLHDAARLTGGLFVSAFQTAIMSRADQPEQERVPVHLYVDEFEAMASDRFESIVAEGRRFGLGLCLSHQNISQLSSGLRHVLRNNVHTQVYFQTGALDAAELCREISGTESKEDVRTALITQGVGEAYLVRRGQRSIRIKTEHSPDPRVQAAAVGDIRRLSFETYARPKAALERELAEREGNSSVLPASAPSDSPTSRSRPATYNIRHDKVRRFKPHDAQEDQPKDQDNGGQIPTDSGADQHEPASASSGDGTKPEKRQSRRRKAAERKIPADGQGLSPTESGSRLPGATVDGREVGGAKTRKGHVLSSANPPDHNDAADGRAAEAGDGSSDGVGSVGEAVARTRNATAAGSKAANSSAKSGARKRKPKTTRDGGVADGRAEEEPPE